MLLWEIFRTFVIIGTVSFGGGYAMIPVIEQEVTAHGWMTTSEFTDIIAIAGMSPGPIATNSAIFVGFKTAGIGGAIVAALGMILPSLTIILFISFFFTKANKHKIVQSAFYGLRPVIVGLIIYAAIKFGISNELFHSFSFQTLASLCIFLGALLALIKYKIHPAIVIVFSGIIGAVLY
ncbi:chromate transporter [Pseudogracilibacillus auburnensis]|uniref:Chromate transporter n=2 Tax=Pseudogracilibacillus auburnensis TaxID=1494959 RepID=A0A2V3VGP9_9BACI|nr:chromate transporter [Pseudogracilibacillus auburnensis]PXW80972.1 chromate transporter [Pseudogracilibacillus auburnensis]